MLKVVVADDSLFMRQMITDMLGSDPSLEVIATAKDGEEAVKKVLELKPDVVTMDIEMPKMNGLDALRQIMLRQPTHVIMLSAVNNADVTLKALEYGAVDFVPKPSGSVSLDINRVKNELISKIKAAPIAKFKIVQRKKAIYRLFSSNRIIAIGASTGGPPAIAEILTNLAEVPPILVVQHMPEGFTKSFAERLNSECSFRVKEAEEGDRIKEGLALVAPGGYHVIVKNGMVHLTTSERVHGVRPSVDIMLLSIAQEYGKRVIGVILTGMGSDGTEGMKAVKEMGGFTIAQSEETCVVYGMPKAAIAKGCVDRVLPLQDIPMELRRIINGL